MRNEITFGSALAISFSLHLLVLSSWALFDLGHFARHKEGARHEIEVFYVAEKSQKSREKETAGLARNYNLEKKVLGPKREVDIAKENEAALTEQPRGEEVTLEEILEHIEADSLREYISYYQLIREDIKQKVTELHTQPSEEGVVYIVFRLERGGKLKRISVNELKSTGGRYLEKTALESVKAASPFPPFPRVLKKRELTFIAPIVFRKE